jgi:cytoskeletal protein CcmA (bactofilin family)
MRSRSRSTTTILLALIGGAVLLGTAAPALAAETANSEFVLIRPDDVLEGDLYAGAIKVSVDGEIDGDLIAFAGEEIIIEGTVTGSVFAVAPRVTVNGSVGGSLRVVATSLTVNGDIGRDIVATAVNVRLGKESKVGGDVLVWAFNMDSLGQIGQNLEGSQRRLSLAGTVGGDVDVSVGRLTIVDDLTVNGDLGYRSDADAEGLDQADVGGAVVHKTPLPPNIRVRALNLFGRFLAVLFLTIAALTTAWGWPNQTIAAIERVRVSPMRSWMSGAVIMALPLFLMALAALLLTLAPTSASFPLLVILAPLILAAVGLVFALSLVAGVPTVGRLGGLLLKKLDVYGAILTGSVVIGIIWMLPVIGWLVPLFVLPLGLGAWLVSRRSSEPTADADEVASNAQADPG